jgi:hypothetical protein
MALLVHPVEVALSGERHQRGPVEVGVGHTGDQIGGPGPERAQTDSGPTGEPPDRIGDEGARLFVVDGHELDRRLVQGLVQIESLLPRYPEDPAHPFRFQAGH